MAANVLSSSFFLSTVISLALSNAKVMEEKPTYLWTSCENSSISNVYDKNMEVDNVFENSTFKMNDYDGQVISLEYSS